MNGIEQPFNWLDECAATLGIILLVMWAVETVLFLVSCIRAKAAESDAP